MNRRQTRARWRSRLRTDSGHKSSPQAARSAIPSSPVAAVSVQIAELQLQSFSRRDGLRVAAAVKQGLSSLLASEGVPDFWLQGQSIERTRLRDVRVSAGAKPQVVGEQLARALLRAGDRSERR